MSDEERQALRRVYFGQLLAVYAGHGNTLGGGRNGREWAWWEAQAAVQYVEAREEHERGQSTERRPGDCP